MKNLKTCLRIFPAIFFVFLLISNNIFPQVVITERVEINPGAQTSNPANTGCYFGNCFYNYCDSTELDLRFTPESIAPGGTTIMKLWGSSYEYDEDTYDILQKTITIEPECGELNYIGGGEYLFTAPDTLTVDSIVVVINYENYNHACGESGSGTPGNKGQDGCLNCFPGAPSLNRHYGTGQITIKWDSLYVEADPSELFPGDTANIIIKKRLFDGTLTDFDTSQTFEAAMLEGCILGKILVGDSLDAYFYDVNQPIKFVADTSADSTGFVLFRIGLVEETLLRKSENDDVDMVDCIPGPPQTETGANIVIEKRAEPTILLGEIKFYGVKKKIESEAVTEILIEEIKVEQDVTPVFPNLSTGWSWIQDSTIWSGRPINIETEGQSPIFYDKFYAQVYYTGTTKPVIHDLPDGMMRVIGRYLGKTIENKVKLFTTEYQSSFTDTLEIQVIRPDKLGDTDRIQNGPTKVEGVFEDYDIDSLIIDIAGETGILPQVIKAIMKKESIGFKPSYRYEIYKDIGGAIRNTFDSSHTYWIKSETEPGYPDIPDHGTIWYGWHTSKDGYPDPITAWDFLMDNYNLYYLRDTTIFVIDPSDSTTTAIYDSEKKKIMKFYNKFYKELKENGLTNQQAEDTAKIKTQQKYLTYIKDEYGEIGMDGIYAQTRIIASYGLMQLTYYGAVNSYRDNWELEYPNNDINYLPEDINIIPINIEYGTKHFLGKLRNALGDLIYPDEDTWDESYGFELSYWNGLKTYNNSSIYPNPVFNFAKNYLPKK